MEISKEILSEIASVVGEKNIYENEPMAARLTMKVGGPARYFFEPKDKAALTGLIRILYKENIPYYVLGNGSNVIAREEGFDGVIIHIGSAFSAVGVSGSRISAGAGSLLKDVSAAALENSLTGFEFACGIPGSTGGGVSMNAGAYGGEMKDIVKEVRTVTQKGEERIFTNEEMAFGYRKSACSDGAYIITEAVFELKKGDSAQIKARMDDLTRQRQEKQPLEYPSSGSTFKRPEGYFAGKLIMDSGLKGYYIGGAQVSEKHCGFVINKGGATSKDVLDLIEYIKKTVYEKQGVRLECEVKILP